MILSFPPLLLFLLVSLSATLAREGNTEDEQAVLRQLLKGPLAPECTKDRSSYFYRSIEGNCNWLLPGETHWGGAGEPLARDHLQYSYKDGIGEPRDGPSAREVSNAFFRRKKSLYYEHTSLLVGMVEFVIHDISTTSRSHAETIPIPVPRCDEFFDPECTGNKTLTMWRTAAVPGTGTNRTNPRESMNGGSTWLDLSPLYGITTEVARKLRAFQHGKLLTQTGPDGGEYLPFDTMGIPMNGWGKDPSELFAGGDSRVNQDWLLVGVHTLLLRNHNRFCDILRAQHPDWDDERLYQYARHANIAHYQVGLNLYQRAYFTPEMSPPAEDGFGLFRTWFGESSWTINPYHSYPWEKTLVRGKPLISSQELAIGYRFHDLIPETLPILNEQGETVTVVRVNNTSFDAKGFLKTGLSGVLRGMVGSTIPNFHSGMSEDYRNARISYALPGEGFGFDMAAWTIVQERERGLPTFNEYFRRYPGSVPVKIREKFEDFTTDPEYLKELKRLYKSPDDVDFSVGLQLDEEYFPGTTVPRTMLITSLFSLFGVGTADRFSVAYSASYCVLVGKPWDCTPLNPVDELLWEPIFVPFFPRARWGSVWFEEIDLAHDGDFALWNLITKNSEVKCLQLNPLWPADPKTNPVACSLPSKRSNPLWTIIWTILGLLLLYFAHSLFSRSSLGTK